MKFVKDSSANISQMNALISDHADRIGFLNGEDVLMLPALMLKAPEMVIGIANFMGPALARLQKASETGDDAGLAALWREINPLVRFIGSGHYNSGVKAACEILGLTVGPLRKPLPGLSPARKEALRALLAQTNPALLTGAARKA